jgi:TonB family protein
VQGGEAATEESFNVPSDDAVSSPEIGSGADGPAYTIGLDTGAEEHLGAFPYSRSRQMDDALARLEINSNELKLHLENIDSRMSRIEPHIEDLSSRAGVPTHRDSTDDWVREPEAEGVHAGAGQVAGSATGEGPPVERRGTVQPSIHADGRGGILAIAPVLLVVVMLGLMAWLWKLEYGSRRHVASPAAANPVASIAGKVTPSVTAAGVTPVPGAVPQSLGAAAVTPPNKVPAAADSASPSEKNLSKPGPSVDHASQRKNRTKRVSSARPAPAIEEASDPSELDVIATSAPGLPGNKSSMEDTGDTAPHLERRSGSTASGAEDMSRGISVSFGIMASHLIESRPPRYPKLARLAHVQGPVVLQAFISKNGTVDHVEAVKGHRLLRGAAKNAVKQWRYRPYLLNGRPVEVATIVTVNFRLEK